MSESTIFLTKATGAGTSGDIDCERFPMRISLYPTANYGSDTGAIQLKNPDGTYDAQFSYDTGSSVALTIGAARPSVVWSGGTVRVVMSGRTSALGVVGSPIRGGAA